MVSPLKIGAPQQPQWNTSPTCGVEERRTKFAIKRHKEKKSGLARKEGCRADGGAVCSGQDGGVEGRRLPLIRVTACRRESIIWARQDLANICAGVADKPCSWSVGIGWSAPPLRQRGPAVSIAPCHVFSLRLPRISPQDSNPTHPTNVTGLRTRKQKTKYIILNHLQ